MASKSEQIILAIATALGSLPWVQGVHRLLLSDAAPDFTSLGASRLPAILLDERLPLPLERAGRPLVLKSRLPVPVWICLPSRREDQPRALRAALGDVFDVLMADPSWGGLALSTVIDPEAQAPPADAGSYVEFGILCNITYLHTPADV